MMEIRTDDSLFMTHIPPTFSIYSPKLWISIILVLANRLPYYLGSSFIQTLAAISRIIPVIFECETLFKYRGVTH